MEKINIENTKAQMRKGFLEFAILLIISEGKVYASEILQKLKKSNLIVVEGTLYPLLSRIKNDNLLEYSWEESKSGPPRKYYKLTLKGKEALKQLHVNWLDLNNSLNSLLKKYEQNS